MFLPVETQLALLAAGEGVAAVLLPRFGAFPAPIFMGDTGSLGLGGAAAGLAVMTQPETLLILIGGIFVIEALSVLIQIVAFQLFRKRVFLMAPIHHHFELKAWSETKIILRFWIITAIGAAIGFTIYAHSLPSPTPSSAPTRSSTLSAPRSLTPLATEAFLSCSASACDHGAP